MLCMFFGAARMGSHVQTMNAGSSGGPEPRCTRPREDDFSLSLSLSMYRRIQIHASVSISTYLTYVE